MAIWSHYIILSHQRVTFINRHGRLDTTFDRETFLRLCVLESYRSTRSSSRCRSAGYELGGMQAVVATA